MNDLRNLTDEFKGMSEPEIIATLDKRGSQLTIAVENLERDFNMGSIIRTGNAFGVRHVDIIGRRQWNKRGAMATDRYLHVAYHESIDAFIELAKLASRHLVAVDNVPGATDIMVAAMPANTTLIFGSEAHGISEALLGACDAVVQISQTGSTRSLNVGAAAAIAMYEWSRQHRTS